MFKTHLIFGFIVGLFALDFFQPSNTILFMTVVMIATALPDIDHPDSKVGKNVKIIGMLFKHRGFFHSLWAISLFTLLVNYFFHNITITTAFLVGYSSHIIIDCFNHGGIMPIHPLSSWKIKGFMKTNGFAEWLLMAGLLIIAVWKLVRM